MVVWRIYVDMKKKRNSKFQYGGRSKSNNKVESEKSTFEKNIENKNNRSTKRKNKDFFSYISLVIVFIICGLYFISLFNDNTKKAIVDYQLILTFILFFLTPFCLWDFMMDNDSQKIKKKKFELYVFILDSIILVILGYLIVFSETAEGTKMVRTILTGSKNILKVIVLILTPLKIYYSSRLFHYSRKEDDRKSNNTYEYSLLSK